MRYAAELQQHILVNCFLVIATWLLGQDKVLMDYFAVFFLVFGCLLCVSCLLSRPPSVSLTTCGDILLLPVRFVFRVHYPLSFLLGLLTSALLILDCLCKPIGYPQTPVALGGYPLLIRPQPYDAESVNVALTNPSKPI